MIASAWFASPASNSADAPARTRRARSSASVSGVRRAAVSYSFAETLRWPRAFVPRAASSSAAAIRALAGLAGDGTSTAHHRTTPKNGVSLVFFRPAGARRGRASGRAPLAPVPSLLAHR